MQRITLFRNFIFSSILFAAMLANFSLKAQIVTNGSFEETDTGSYASNLAGIKGWLMQLSDGAVADFSIVEGDAQKGNKSLKIVIDTAGTNAWSVQAVGDSLDVVPGHSYTYTVWAKANVSGTQVNITVGNYSYSEYGAIRPASLTTDWQKFTINFTVSDAQTIIRAPIHFNSATNVGREIYIDNLMIKDNTAALNPIIVEAESGVVGSGFNLLQDGEVDYATIQTTSSAYNPEDTSRVITFDVTFPDSGSYDLFARVRVGDSTFKDYSFLYGNGFGEKDATVDSLWIFANGLATAGFSGAEEVVREAGGLGSGVWKWINLSRNAFPSKSVTFIIEEDSLNKKFQIGGREDGLDIDKFAFGKSYLFYTVENLDSVTPGSVVDPTNIWQGPPLASNQPKFVGNIYSTPQKANFASYWNQVIAENAGKWGSVEGTRDVYNWAELDASYKLAKDNGFLYNFHVLLWGAQQPAWINDLTAEEQLEEIQEWFDSVAVRYPDIDVLQVLNEPLNGHNPPDGQNGRANYKTALGGNGTTGWDWILTAFRMARATFPNTKLMLNDFSIINDVNATSTYKTIIKLLQKENLIDVIGEQGHAFTTTATNSVMKRNLDTLAKTGLPIHITELDIDGTDDNVQLNSYKRIFPLLYQHSRVEGITLWGWRPGLWRNTEGAYLVNQSGAERPSLVWLRDYLDTVSVNPVSVEDVSDLPTSFSLSNNYPNPFNPETIINYSIPSAAKVSLVVYDILGKEVATLVNDVKSAGHYSAIFNANNLASGVYFYRLNAGDFSSIKKMVLLK